MRRDTDKNLFIVSSMPRFYQQLFSGIGTYQELGNRIIGQIKAAHAFRQVDRVRELSLILINIPVKECQLIAEYYIVWSGYRETKYDIKALERIIEQTQVYKTKALFSRGAVEWYKGNSEAALSFYIEAMKTSPSVSDYIVLSRSIAVLKSTEGFHESALRDLENLLPIIKHAEPLVYFDVLNSYAVELSEAGRKDEARNVINQVIASPFAHAYPEWQETAKELKELSRTSISVPQIERKLVEVEIKETPHASAEAKPSNPGRVVSFPPLKEAPKPKRPEIIGSQEFADMSSADKREFILAAVRTELLPETEYNKMVFMLGLVKSDAAPNVIDLEDEKVLNDLMIEWAHLIEPDELAGVLSALRDCEDDQRRTTIIDKMIRKVFEYSRVCNITESDWRLKVERRLPKIQGN
jgi:tetratricopeptide (TPR) repeat protein